MQKLRPYIIPGLVLFPLLLLTATPVSARKWTSSDGKFSVEAELVEAKNGNVRLKRRDGKDITVPVSRLSKEDLGPSLVHCQG